jgi:inosine-uridine nucleoside N-ribohydrolase
MRRDDRAVWTLTCDPGIDDAVALVVVAGRRGDADLAAVVAGAGNVPVPVAWRNAAGLAALLGLDVPLGAGSPRTVSGDAITRGPSSHGADGLGGLADRLPTVGDPPAADGALVRGDVIATGPLTDVARALRAGRPVAHVVWMGGSASGIEGAGTVGAEFNAAADPSAADEVLGSGVPVRVVPIEITAQVGFGADDVAEWRSGPLAARLCADLLDRRRGGRWPVLLHDPVAVVAAVEPDLFRWEDRVLRCRPDGVLAAGPERSARSPCAVAVAVDAPAVRRRIVDAVAAVGGERPP